MNKVQGEFSNRLLKHFEEMQLQYEVESLYKDMVNHLQIFDANEKLKALERHATLSNNLCLKLLQQLDELESAHTQSIHKIERIQRKAFEARETFVNDIGMLLKDTVHINALRHKVDALQKELYVCHEIENDLKLELHHLKNTALSNTQELFSLGNRNITNQEGLSNKKKMKTKRRQNQHLNIFDINDESLLEIFSYLTTVDVIYFSLASRGTFDRVDSLFGLNSTVVRDGWDSRSVTSTDDTFNSIKPALSPNSSGRDNGNADVGSHLSSSSSSNATIARSALSREMADGLAKKLNASELKAILGLSDRLRKEISLNLDGNAEREDLAAKLQSTESVRNFLADKLKSVEAVAKASKAEISNLKMQITGDQEVISFLDLKIQGLETSGKELYLNNQRLQAAYDLQMGAHSHSERELQTRVEELTLNLETAAAQAKSEKIVLVREVLALRSKLSAATRERDQYLAQLLRVRDAFAYHSPAESSTKTSVTASSSDMNAA